LLLRKRFEHLPVRLARSRQTAQELDQFGDCTPRRVDRDELADRSSVPLNHKDFAAVVHPVYEISKGVSGLRRRDMGFHGSKNIGNPVFLQDVDAVHPSRPFVFIHSRLQAALRSVQMS
jgi:hypothetical protein